MENGSSRKWQGGVMVSAVLIIGILSILLLGILENQRMTFEFSVRNQQLYEARIMREMFLAKYFTEESLQEERGELVFNQGKINYEKTTNQLIIRIKIRDVILGLNASNAEQEKLQNQYEISK